MQSDLFLSRQRKPRNRQLRKPLVVQVREEQKDDYFNFGNWLNSITVIVYKYCTLDSGSNLVRYNGLKDVYS